MSWSMCMRRLKSLPQVPLVGMNVTLRLLGAQVVIAYMGLTQDTIQLSTRTSLVAFLTTYEIR